VVAAIGLGFALGGPSACSQPAALCATTPGEGIARYTLASGSGTCPTSNLPLASATNPHPGSFPIGVEVYPVNPTDPNGSTTPAAMALQPEWIGARIEDAVLNAAVDPSLSAATQAAMANYPYGDAAAPLPPPQGTSTSHPYSWGQFTTVTPDSSGICHANLEVSLFTYPDVPAHTAQEQIDSPNIDPGPAEDGGPGVAEYVVAGEKVPDQPATTVQYKWSNVRVYVTAAADGAQTYADLAATQDGCTMSYHVSIMVPRILCMGTDDAGTLGPDPTLCNPFANAVNPSGSGINQTISPTCENIGTATDPDYECLPPSPDPLSQLQ
jgi:hypothetical protein